MPYGKSYRYRKYRKYRRGKTLRKTNILTNRSAKSQAYQISALSRKVNRLYYKSKPEYKVLGDDGHHQFDLSSADTGNTVNIMYFDGPTQGTGDSNRIGDKINSISYSWYGYFEYYNNSTTGYHNSESSGAPMRLIVLQRKIQTTPGQNINIADILAISGTSGSSYSCQVMAPLKKGVTETYHILADRKFVLTTERNQKLFRIKVKPRNLRFNGSNDNGLIICAISSGLHWDSNFTEAIRCYWSQKYVFTDA